MSILANLSESTTILTAICEAAQFIVTCQMDEWNNIMYINKAEDDQEPENRFTPTHKFYQMLMTCKAKEHMDC